MSRLTVTFLLACTVWTGCSVQPQSPASRARLAFDRQNFADAERYCSECLAETPDNVDMLMLRGRSLAMLGRHDAAVQDFSQVIELRPDDPEPLYRRQLSYRELGETHLAERDDLAAKAIDPKFGSAYQFDPSTFIRQPSAIRNPAEGQEERVVDEETEPPADEPKFAESEPSTAEREADQIASSADSRERPTDASGRGPATDVQKFGRDFQKPDGMTVIDAPHSEEVVQSEGEAEDPLTEPEEVPRDALHRRGR